MSMTAVATNVHEFAEIKSNDKQPLVTNNLGRDTNELELVYLDGYFGEVLKSGGIADTETGRINIDSDREIRTKQVHAADTYAVGGTIWFVSGGAGAAGKLRAADPGSGTVYAAGIITGEEGTGGAQTAVTFRPFAQRLDAADVSAAVITNTAAIGTLASLTTTSKGNLVAAVNEVDADIGVLSTLTTAAKTSAVAAVNEVDADIGVLSTLTTAAKTSAVAAINEVDGLVDGILAEPRILVQEVTTGAASIAITGLTEGDEIIDVMVIATGASTNGTIQIQDGAAGEITDAMVCAVDKAITRAASIDAAKSTLPASGAKIVCAGDSIPATVAKVIITYIPA
jgi:hypothetical protein